MMYEIDVDKINNIKDRMKKEIDDLNVLCKECYKKIEETKEVFDTPTSKLFREKANELILQGQKYVEGTVMPFIDNLSDVVRQYEELFKFIQTKVKADGGNK